MVKSGRVPGKGKIRASIEKLFEQVQEKGRISVSTQKMVESRRVPKKGLISMSK